MKPILVSSGEPAGIGPDLALALADYGYPVVVLGDKKLFKERAELLKLEINFEDYQQNQPLLTRAGHLTILNLDTRAPVVAGQLNSNNASYVIAMLNLAAKKCSENEFSALVTGPVHKAIINEAGMPFTGHTEFLADYYHCKSVVMLLACSKMKIALATTHLPLKEVPLSLTKSLLTKVIQQLHQSLQQDFGINHPKIWVAGLNPHAGEAGYLGREEIDIIKPVVDILAQEGMDVRGPFPADTLFTPQYLQEADAFLAMYHDQGLPVLKYASFDSAVNITLGLPIIRTSVDHGTALNLAGTGKANPGSLIEAVKTAISMVEHRKGSLNGDYQSYRSS